MDINYGAPLSKGMKRMKKALFNPFDPGKWFAVGFTAFLAGLAGGSGNGGGSYKSGKDNWDIQNLADFPREAWDWLMSHPVWFGLIIFGILLLFALGILLTWLSSRGKFMFLDNVVHEPWRKAPPLAT